jgi:hypothetical protein
MTGLSDLISSPQARQALSGLVQHFDNGSMGQISHADAADQHTRVASQLDNSAYHDAAQASVKKLTPAQRDTLGHHLTSAATSHGLDLGSLLGGASSSSSGGLASILGAFRSHQGTPATTALLGSGSGLQGEIGKLVLGGIAAAAAKRFMG